MIKLGKGTNSGWSASFPNVGNSLRFQDGFIVVLKYIVGKIDKASLIENGGCMCRPWKWCSHVDERVGHGVLKS